MRGSRILDWKAVLKEYDSDRRGRTSRQSRVGISSGGGGTSCGVAEGAMVKGGGSNAILEERVMRSQGDPDRTQALFGSTPHKASQPYCKMLIQWVAKGIPSMTPTMSSSSRKASRSLRGTLDEDFTDEYWERKYTSFVNRAATAGGWEQMYILRLAMWALMVPLRTMGDGHRREKPRGGERKGVWGGGRYYLDSWKSGR
ncbi:hypothetical protein Pst134EB_022124 [Puccinia striiformis f. sp. tritici]|nr:hypothetical protein Pst134EB_022124 [Puccinia striiformis f. sp. tritici]